MDITTIISDIIVSIFTDCISRADVKFIERLKFRKLKKKITATVSQFLKQYDGSVLTTGAFAEFLSNHHPLEKMFTNISGKSANLPKEQCINEQTERFSSYYPFVKVTPADQSYMKELFAKLYEIMESYYREHISEDTNYLAGTVQKTKAELSADIQEQSNHIAHMDRNMEELKSLLMKSQELEDEDTIWSVYTSLIHAILNGRAGEVYTVYPLLEGKSRDLQLAITYLLNCASDIKVQEIPFETVEKKISNERIYADLTVKAIYLALCKDDQETLKAIGERNPALHEISGCLLAGKYDVFYTKEVKDAAGQAVIAYTMSDKFREYLWLVKHICMFAVLAESIVNAAECAENVLGEDICVIDQVMLSEIKLKMMISQNNAEQGAVKKYRDTLQELKESVKHLPQQLQTKFYGTCLRAAFMFAEEEADEIIKSIPEGCKADGTIAMLIMMQKVNKGEASGGEVLDLCVKNDAYWLFGNFIARLASENEKEAKKLIDRHLFVIDRDPAVFLVYAKLVQSLEGNARVIELYQTYEEKYGNVCEFCVEKMKVSYDPTEVKNLIERWEKHDMERLFPRGDMELYQLLMQHKLYKETLRCIAVMEKAEPLSVERLQIKARALLAAKQEIEALEAYKTLFEKDMHSGEVVYYILALSENNKRKVPDPVLQYAKLSKQAELLGLAAAYEAANGSMDEANELFVKALLRTKRNDTFIYGRYLLFHIREEHVQEKTISSVNTDTAVRYVDEDGNEKCICIHAAKVLPEEPYIWEHAEHIYAETAIQRGLLRKKAGDTMQLNGVNCKITAIDSIDAFLFQVCMEHMVRNGDAHKIEAPVGADEKTDIAVMMEMMKKLLKEKTSDFSWQEHYEHNAVPVSIWYYKRYVRVTYTQLLEALVQDASVVYRGIAGSVEKADQYILSASALVVLKKLGFPLGKLDGQVYIASSLGKIVADDKDAVIAANNREKVAAMGLQNEQLYMVETSDDMKQVYMEEAVELNTYAFGLATKDNHIDIPLETAEQLDFKEFLGVADYDAMCIAKTEELTLMTAEIPLVPLASAIQVETIYVADFINAMCDDLEEVLQYIEKMEKYRFLIPVTAGIVRRLMETYQMADMPEQKMWLDRWNAVLKIPLEDATYAERLANVYKQLLAETRKKDEEDNQIWSSMLYAAVSYAGYSVRVGIVDGVPKAKLVKERIT